MDIIAAEEQHISAIQKIYAHHVIHGTASFETEPPDINEMRARLKKNLDASLPWFVASKNGRITGYCYLSRYRERKAYQYTLEDSIYVDPQCQQQGVGKALLAHAIEWAEQRGFRQLIAIVGNSENEGSLHLHRQAGFSLVGTLASVGLKHGRWLDTVMLQRALGEEDSTLPESTPRFDAN
ncbi:N-acetyltransferase [Candidatus Symbiopectobacterium sp. 'North America']|uniref:GNAT family N-acetyltransferase n=1 Tax=Candidatus Symbiopectobacterium sp. 'North America' TaxID=2794574 RepID=UPI0018CB0E69|nr:GNAT family N-acetyltransferase [Candidatus Symbiopectobacterium sp. 'North America']MBG6245081.1 N-acetyltransferase [Candidatus Symbiopectobacterium sp. 'North America']